MPPHCRRKDSTLRPILHGRYHMRVADLTHFCIEWRRASVRTVAGLVPKHLTYCPPYQHLPSLRRVVPARHVTTVVVPATTGGVVVTTTSLGGGEERHTKQPDNRVTANSIALNLFSIEISLRFSGGFTSLEALASSVPFSKTLYSSSQARRSRATWYRAGSAVEALRANPNKFLWREQTTTASDFLNQLLGSHR